MGLLPYSIRLFVIYLLFTCTSWSLISYRNCEMRLPRTKQSRNQQLIVCNPKVQIIQLQGLQGLQTICTKTKSLQGVA